MLSVYVKLVTNNILVCFGDKHRLYMLTLLFDLNFIHLQNECVNSWFETISYTGIAQIYKNLCIIRASGNLPAHPNLCLRRPVDVLQKCHSFSLPLFRNPLKIKIPNKLAPKLFFSDKNNYNHNPGMNSYILGLPPLYFQNNLNNSFCISVTYTNCLSPIKTW